MPLQRPANSSSSSVIISLSLVDERLVCSFFYRQHEEAGRGRVDDLSECGQTILVPFTPG